MSEVAGESERERKKINTELGKRERPEKERERIGIRSALEMIGIHT